MTLFDIDVTDDDVTISGMTIASLAPGASDGTTFTGSYTITQDDIDAGFFTNTSQVDAAAGASGGHPVSHTDDESVLLPQDPSLVVDNTGTWVDGDADGFADPGELVNYVITVFNDGNVTLHDVEVDDPLLGGLLSGPTSGDADNDDLLDVGETWTYNASYAITQGDIDAGTVHNDATASALGPQDQSTSDSDDDDTSLPQNPSLAASMSASIPDEDEDGEIDSPADDITYTITLVNDGNVTLHNVTFTDPSLGTLSAPTESGDTNGILEVGETWTYSALYGVEQSDIDNRGSVDGTADDNIRNEIAVTTDELAGDSASADMPIDYRPQMMLEKIGVWIDVGEIGVAEEGEIIDYTFRITNTGNVTLTEIGVSDTLGDVLVFGSNIPSLAPGAVDDTTWSATHEITNVDVLAGFFDNDASAISLETSTSASSHVVLPDGSGFAMVGGGTLEKWEWQLDDYLF
jgi:uncharacterized repeat protein (TIGR01451 family)